MEDATVEENKTVIKNDKLEMSDGVAENEDEGEIGSGYRSDKEGSESGSDVSDRVTTSKDSDGYEVDCESNRESNSKDSLNGEAENETVGSTITKDPKSEDDSDHFEEAVDMIEDAKPVSKSENDSEGYEEGIESGSEESDVPSDSNRHNDSTGYNEESDDDDDENNTKEVKVQRKRQGAKEDDESEEEKEKSDSDTSDDVLIESDENKKKDGGDWGSDAEGSEEGEQEKEQKVTRQAVVPRRTRFWDHDNRFDDITIEESRETFDQSREEARNKKLWDRTAEKWEHDLFREEDQAPKEEWEKQEQANNRRDDSQQQRRRERTVGDYIQNARGRGGRYNPRRNYNQRETKEDSISMRVKEEQQNSNKDERANQESRSNEEPETRVAPKNRRYFNRDENKTEQSNRDEQFPALKSEAEATSEPSTSEVVKKVSNRSERETPKVKVEKQKKKEVSEKTRDVKEKTDKENVNKEKNVEASAKKEQRPAKGRGRGMTNENLRKGQKTAADFNKEKKVTDNERSLVQKLKEQHESKQEYDDVEESETKSGAKPKRYSSQRLKQTNASDAVGDGSEIPAAQFAPQFPGMHEEMQYYPQVAGMPAQMPSMQGIGPDSVGTSQLMMQRLMQQQQMIQMQMQQLRMHQQQQPQIIHQPVPVMESTQSSVPDLLPPQAPGTAYVMPTQAPQPTTMPYQPVQPSATGTIPMQQSMNPEEYQMIMNQMMAPRMFMAPQPPGGLFIPNQMQQQHQQHTRQAQVIDDEARMRQRNAAIPIKPPPEILPAES